MRVAITSTAVESFSIHPRPASPFTFSPLTLLRLPLVQHALTMHVSAMEGLYACHKSVELYYPRRGRGVRSSACKKKMLFVSFPADEGNTWKKSHVTQLVTSPMPKKTYTSRSCSGGFLPDPDTSNKASPVEKETLKGALFCRTSRGKSFPFLLALMISTHIVLNHIGEKKNICHYNEKKISRYCFSILNF